MKPITKFDLSVNDIEIIERSLRANAGRRGMKILKGEGDFVTLKCEADEIMDLLGRLHQQKTWFRPKKETYVGG